MIELSPAQAEAYAALENYMKHPTKRVFVMFGYAGTGKTTLLARLAQEYPHTILCTLTGKAASVLRDKTGLTASTLHSVFFWPDGHVIDEKTGRKSLTWLPRHEPGELAGHVVMIDECMMVGQTIMQAVLDSGACVIACGDPNQLWPVMDQPYFETPDITLSEVHRQAFNSPILRQAHAVRLGGRYQVDGDEFRVVPFASDELVSEADMILCWTHKHRAMLNSRARRLHGFNEGSLPQAGEPVMCLRNVHEMGLYNGAIYKLLAPINQIGVPVVTVEVDGHSTTVCAGFEDLVQTPPVRGATAFAFGYACTVHKAAGSEWSNVLLFDTFMRRTPSHAERPRWLYTGITRAADRMTVVM